MLCSKTDSIHSAILTQIISEMQRYYHIVQLHGAADPEGGHEGDASPTGGRSEWRSLSYETMSDAVCNFAC